MRRASRKSSARRDAADPAAAEQVRAGNAKAIGALVGPIMRETRGHADGAEVTRLIHEALAAGTSESLAPCASQLSSAPSIAAACACSAVVPAAGAGRRLLSRARGTGCRSRRLCRDGAT